MIAVFLLALGFWMIVTANIMMSYERENQVVRQLRFDITVLINFFLGIVICTFGVLSIFVGWW
jgi:hypothetical protein